MNNESIKNIALSNGFKLKQQPDGEMELNPYVYDFAKSLNEELLKENAELARQLKIRDELSCGTCRGAGTVLISSDDGMDRPECAQHLADIQADAVFAVAQGWIIHTDSDYDARVKLIEISNKLRGE